MSDLKPDDAAGLKYGPDGLLLPTKASKALLRFDYVVSKPSATDRLFSLEQKDLLFPSGGIRRGMFRRGSGAARALLSAADCRKGVSASACSMACGNTLVRFRESTSPFRQPTLELLFFVMTMDTTGHVLWPTVFGQKTKAMLRKRLRGHIKTMMLSKQHPVDSSFDPALTSTGEADSLWKPPKRQRLVEVED